VVRKLHQILKPFMLRRTKQEVETSIPPKKEIYIYVGLSTVQQKIYKNVLLKKNPIDGDSKNYYLNIMMQLRKVCNHPYLFDGVEEEGSSTLGEHLVQVLFTSRPRAKS
jgi:SWI/SNF-related matrix-associated actin-dependent regulator of chromatin subfamily A member 5